jgi:hypothetical protein
VAAFTVTGGIAKTAKLARIAKAPPNRRFAVFAAFLSFVIIRLPYLGDGF